MNHPERPNNGTSFTDFSDIVRQVQAPVRLHGLAPASRTRDYFLSDIPEDGYSMDRTEIQRGPNGMLYGLGSPAGVINAVSSKANVQRGHTNVGTRLDNYGRHRVSFDHNHVILPDKLALRIRSRPRSASGASTSSVATTLTEAC